MINAATSANRGQNYYNSMPCDETAVFNISLFKNKTDNSPQLVQRSWQHLCDKFRQPQVRLNKDGLLFSGATFEPALRRKENVKELSLLVFDVDHNSDFDHIKTQFDNLKCAYAIHSTHSHLRQIKSNPNAEPRFRVVVPLLKTVPVKDFPNLWQYVKFATVLPFDESAKDASRIFYAPAIAETNAPYVCHIQSGVFLDWGNLPLDAFAANELNANVDKSESVKPSATSVTLFASHEIRHEELCRRIERAGRNTGRGGFEMKCPSHNGSGNSSLFYDTESGAVACLKKPQPCSYFEILRAFSLSDERLPSQDRYDKTPLANDEQATFDHLPEPSDKCFYGLTGEFVRAVEPHSEADKMALLVQFLAFFGVIIGRNAHFLTEADKQFCNLYVCLVGNTATGRKGTSKGRVEEVFNGIDADFDNHCKVSGLASGEGLVYHVRDAVFDDKTDKKTGKTETVCTDKGVTDKRLLVFEGEFAQVLRVQKRETNTLSIALRNFWDSGTNRNLSKNSPLRCTNAHVSLVAHITKAELLACLEEIEAANGGLNRYLFVCVNRSKLLPFGGEVPANEINQLKISLKAAVDFAQKVERMQFTLDAAKLWAVEYKRLETSRFGYLAQVTQRASPYALRLACIFALLDKEKFINPLHLEAALAVWQYCEDSARYIFGANTSDKLANKILALLRTSGANGLTKTEIHDLTKHAYDAKRLNAALKTLLENRLAQFQNVIQSGSKKPIEKWFPSKMFSQRDELAEFNQSNEATILINSANSTSDEQENEKIYFQDLDNKDDFSPSNGKLFEVAPENNQTKDAGEEPPLHYTFACWICKAIVSNQDSVCPNCEQNLNEPPF